MSHILYVRVALPVPLHKLFDYRLVCEDPALILPGIRLRVPWGKRVLTAILIETATHSAVPLQKIKEVSEILDETPLISSHLLALAQFAANYYHAPLGEVLDQMLPKALREGRKWEDIQVKPIKEKNYPADEKPLLTEEQSKAIEQIMAKPDVFHVTLLQGVTGSGKTEVYLQVIEPVLAAGKQVLILVPEIGLTPQTLSRFAARLQTSIEVLHSGLTQATRLQAWMRLRQGETQVLIATRSGVFTPFKNLGLVIIDEEHDLSFKQQEGFRYHARDLAIWRAKQCQVPVILGSATPSFESLRQVQKGVYQLVTLKNRAQGEVPSVQLVDLRGQTLKGGMSAQLLNEIKKRLSRKEQVLLFLNRRGFAPTWLCHTCGSVAQCKHCDARLTFHADQRLICHHCGHQSRRSQQCQSCGSEEYILMGEGTQRIESILANEFPQARIARVDRDSTRSKNAFDEILNGINSGEVDILLGTQMLAKGHHFPAVTLVGILDADQGLLSSDFRASERFIQLLTQVSGRAGRAALPGTVVLQTHHPDHPLLRQWMEGGYTSFSEQALQDRAQFKLPPFGYLTLIRAQAKDPQKAMLFLEQIRTWLLKNTPVQVRGPIPAIMEKRQGQFRAQLLLHEPLRAALHKSLQALMQVLDTGLFPKGVKWSVDVDPQEMM